MNSENTLFLITIEGERHEDHIPQYIWPLSKIKNYVTPEVYMQLCLATDWVTDVNWFDIEQVEKEYHQEFENIRLNNEQIEDSLFDSYLGGAIIWPMKFHPIILDENNCMKFENT